MSASSSPQQPQHGEKWRTLETQVIEARKKARENDLRAASAAYRAAGSTVQFLLAQSPRLSPSQQTGLAQVQRDVQRELEMVSRIERQILSLNVGKACQWSSSAGGESPPTDPDPDVFAPPRPPQQKRATPSTSNRRVTNGGARCVSVNRQPPNVTNGQRSIRRSESAGTTPVAAATRGARTPKQPLGKKPREAPPSLDATVASLADEMNTLNSTANSSIDSQEKPTEFDAAGFPGELVDLIESSVVIREPNVLWSDIIGLKDIKDAIHETIVMPTLAPHLFTGIRRPPRAAIMVGPPGTGKTLVAKAIASERRTTFFSVSASTFASKWRGDSEKLVQLLFRMARHHAPATVFIDEIDSLCAQRGAATEHEASRRVKSELLVQMDGLAAETEASSSVFVLAATNHPWDLDDALRRRFEKRIYIPPPDRSTRVLMLQDKMKDVSMSPNVRLEKIADKTDNYSGADIAIFCREAAMMPIREYRNATQEQLAQLDSKSLLVTQEHLETALKRMSPSINREMIVRYEKWIRDNGVL